MKRLELLELRQQQLAGRRQSDPEITKQIEELRAKVAAYEAPRPRVVEEAPRAAGLVKLGKKTAQGVVPIEAP
jgi:hypothetical protein